VDWRVSGEVGGSGCSLIDEPEECDDDEDPDDSGSLLLWLLPLLL
jgi:hypothetical protein